MLGDTAQTDGLDAAAETFAAVRPRLFGIAYRMLGTVADAEDIVQDTWVRWQNARPVDACASPRRSWRRRRPGSRSTWRSRRGCGARPTSARGCPSRSTRAPTRLLGAERGEALEFAVLVLLEKLTPTERAAYVLREAFDYPYPQIAEIIQGVGGVRPAARQPRAQAPRRGAPRARGRPRRSSDGCWRRSWRRRSPATSAALERIFTADIVSYSDGGGLARASRIPVFTRGDGRQVPARVRTRGSGRATIHLVEANGAPSAVARPRRCGRRVPHPRCRPPTASAACSGCSTRRSWSACPSPR